MLSLLLLLQSTEPGAAVEGKGSPTAEIPRLETVVQIDYRKGPYRGDLGDFALAGAALITTTNAY